MLEGTTAPRVVTFPRITGAVSPINPSDDNGAGGDRIGPTDVSSYRGIAGIRHQSNGMFLVGVFLPDVELLDHAPPRLDFTKRDRFRSLAPRLGQTFLIGDGKGRSYKVPAGTTRLYAGFADGYSLHRQAGLVRQQRRPALRHRETRAGIEAYGIISV